MPNTTGGRGVPRYVKQTPEQQQAYMEQLQSMYMGAYDPSQYYQQVRYVNCSRGLLSCLSVRAAEVCCALLCRALRPLQASRNRASKLSRIVRRAMHRGCYVGTRR
jgi:hypothetical protein